MKKSQNVHLLHNSVYYDIMAARRPIAASADSCVDIIMSFLLHCWKVDIRIGMWFAFCLQPTVRRVPTSRGHLAQVFVTRHTVMLNTTASHHHRSGRLFISDK